MDGCLLALSKYLIPVFAGIAFSTAPRLIETEITMSRLVENVLISDRSPTVKPDFVRLELPELLNRIERDGRRVNEWIAVIRRDYAETFIQIKANVAMKLPFLIARSVC